MTRVNFEMADSLIRRMDEVLVQRGFGTRAEFFRYIVMEFLKKNENSPRLPETTVRIEAVRMEPLPGQMEDERPLSLKDRQIAEAKKKLDYIMDTQGAEYGVPAEAVEQIEKIAKLMRKT